MQHSPRRLFAILLLGMLPAQQPQPHDQIGVHVAGARSGTMQYLVTFHERDFDLSQFRGAVLAHRSADEVTTIVADLERKAASNQRAFGEAVERAGGRVIDRWWLINGSAIEVNPAEVDGLLRLPNVASITPNRTTMPLIITATNASNHNSDGANAAGATGRGVTVAIMDTGLDALSGATGRPHPTFYINGDINNHTGPGLDGSRLLDNVMVGVAPPDNTHPHGTGVASISAGFKWSLAANHDSGHAYDASVVGYSISNVASSGQSSEATMAAAWQRIAAERVKHNIGTANNSYSGTSCNLTDMIQMALDAAAYNADILIQRSPTTNVRTSSRITPARSRTTSTITSPTRPMIVLTCPGPMNPSSPMPGESRIALIAGMIVT